MQHKSSLSLSLVCLAAAACTTTPVSQGVLTNYENLAGQKGMLAKRRAFADTALLGEQGSVFIAPVAFAPGLPDLRSEEREFLTNALSRAICDRIDDRIKIADAQAPDTLNITVTITELKKTNVAAAAASVVALRAPIGLGALGVEAEALTPDRRQAASMIWRRQADALFTGARASSIGDAYNFAGQFGAAFGSVLRRGFGDRRVEHVRENSCQRFGSTRLSTSVLEMISPIQLPPSWEERRARPPSE